MSRSENNNSTPRISEIKNLGFRLHINQMGAAVQGHVAEKPGFIQFPVVGTGSADTGLDSVFHEIGQVVRRAIPGCGFSGQIPIFIRPFSSWAYVSTCY